MLQKALLPLLCLPWVGLFLLSSIPMSTDRLTSSDKREIWTCTQSTYSPEPNLDMYAVRATIQLILAKNVVERIHSCFPLKSGVRSLQSQRQNPDHGQWHGIMHDFYEQ